MRSKLLSAICALTGMISPVSAENDRSAWFTEARLGGFIHWSAGGVFGARWFGEPLRNPVPYGEWARHRNRVPRADYDAAIARMSATPEAVDGWVKAFKDAGFGYVVFVAKHHDGLAFWPSQASGYTFSKLSGCGVDVCGEMRRACDRHGMKLGFYYSQWHDWEHPDGWGNFWDNPQMPAADEWRGWRGAQYSGASATPGLTPERFGRYWREKCIPQVVELLENYRPDLLWFDCYIPREQSIMSAGQVEDLLRLIRGKAPACLVNSRLGIATIGGPDGVDFQTLGDNRFGSELLPHPWETAATLNHSWGYNRDDHDWKPARFFLESAVRNIALGGNLTLNIGPRPDASLPEDTVSRMAELARVIPPQLGAFRGCGPVDLDVAAQDWGLATARGSDLFLHILEWPVDGVIRVTGLKSRALSARLLAGGGELPLQQDGLSLRVNGPPSPPLPWDSVIQLRCEAPPACERGLTGEINGGGWHLGPATAAVGGGLAKAEGDGGWLPPHFHGFNAGGAAVWRVHFPAAGRYEMKICQACPKACDQGELEILLDGVKTAAFQPVATAPDNSEFFAFDLPPLEIPEAGVHEISLRAAGNTSGDLRIAWMFVFPFNP